MFLKAGVGVRAWAKRGISGVAILATLFFILSGSYAWLEGWQYRKQIVITENSGSTLTDYQVLITLNSSNFDFSKAKNDGSDIRFTDNNDNLLSYYIDEWNSTSQTAKIWVKVSNIPASSSTTIYMYYGNSEVTSLSNGNDVFRYFETCNTESSKFNWYTQSGYKMGCDLAYQVHFFYKTAICDTKTKVIVKHIDLEAHEFWFYINDGPYWDASHHERIGVSGSNFYQQNYGTITSYSLSSRGATRRYGKTIEILKINGNSYKYYHDGQLVADGIRYYSFSCKYFGYGYWSGDDTYVKYFAIAKYANVEPTYEVKEEETAFSMKIQNANKIYAASKVLINITTSDYANITANVTYNNTVISQNSCTNCKELSWLVDTAQEGQYNITAVAETVITTIDNATFTVNRSITFSHDGILKVFNKNTWQANLANTVEDAEDLTLTSSLKNINDSIYLAENTTGISYLIQQQDAHNILEHEVYLCDVYGACWKYSKTYTVENSEPIITALLEKDQHYLAGETITLHPYYYDVDNDPLNLTFYLYNNTGLVKSFTSLTFSTGSIGVFTLEIKVCDAYNCSYANYTLYADAAINCLDSNLFTYYVEVPNCANYILLNNTAYCLYDISDIANYNFEAQGACLYNSTAIAMRYGGTALIRYDNPNTFISKSCGATTEDAKLNKLPKSVLWHPTVTLNLKKEEDGTTWDDFTSYNISIKAYCSKYGDYEEKITAATYTGKRLRELPRRIDVVAQGDITVKSGIADYSNYYYRSIVPDTWQNINKDVYLSESKDKIYRLIWNLQDLVGTWGDSKLIIKKYVAGKLVTITENYWDAESKAITYLVDGESYYVSIAKDGEERGFGWFDADSNSLEKQITISELSLTNPLILYGKDVAVEVKTTTDNNNSYILINYNDNLEQTQSVDIYIYNFTSGEKLFSTTSTANSFSITYQVEDRNTTYLVSVTIKHNILGTITQEWTINFNENVFLLEGINENVREWVAIALLLFTAVLFTAANTKIAAVLLIIEVTAFAFWGWLSINTALLWLLIILGAIAILSRRV